MADAVVEEREIGLRQAEIKAKLDAASANLWPIELQKLKLRD